MEKARNVKIGSKSKIIVIVSWSEEMSAIIVDDGEMPNNKKKTVEFTKDANANNGGAGIVVVTGDAGWVSDFSERLREWREFQDWEHSTFRLIWR